MPCDRQYCQAFDHVADYTDAGSDYAWVNIYNESHATNPLDVEGTGIVGITGSDGQEDFLVASEISADQAIGKDVGGCREGLRLRFIVAVVDFNICSLFSGTTVL